MCVGGFFVADLVQALVEPLQVCVPLCAQVLAVGDAAGVLHLFELPRTLRRPLQNEWQLMETFVAREAARVADVASRQVCVRVRKPHHSTNPLSNRAAATVTPSGHHWCAEMQTAMVQRPHPHCTPVCAADAACYCAGNHKAAGRIKEGF